ncbi:ScpA family protein [Kistimonas scapharcae]|uniref:Segregation and condensation protein A n=1 Tax=Kistimonas scapharcae TaxID=1036133 RepID=A0ABP8V8N7_9GAMM
MDADTIDQSATPDEQVPEAPAETVEGALEQSVRLAVFRGEILSKLPDDLYIPPEALEVFLEAFEGPLDLLLYLIKRNNVDILEMPVAEITRQYMSYVELMQASQFELAAEYLVMAATLAEIKSRMLLPRQTQLDDEEEDPRAELIRRLQEYERFKIAAEDLDSIPRQGRDFYLASAEPPKLETQKIHPDVDLREVLLALSEVLGRADLFEDHHIEREALSTRERMAQVLSRLKSDGFTPFVALFTVSEGRLGVVVTFLAIMELIKESLVELVQTEPFGPIHVKARTE